MSWVDSVITELQKSEKVSPETLVAIGNFLQQHQAVLESVGQEVRQAFLAALAQGDAGRAWEAVTATMTSAQVLTLLKDSAAEAAQLAAARAVTVGRFQSVIDGAGAAALQLLARAAIALL